jgi:fructose-1,6-bisphosphatase II / sedoheptulose-1,7-bisphosphatase
MKLSKAEGAKSPAHLHRSLTLELVRVTERAAIAAAEWRGKGNEQAADEAAVLAMKAELDRVAIAGRIVIGEGEEQRSARCCIIGQAVGAGEGPEVDIAVDPLEGVTLCAKNQPDSIVVLAMAERGGLLNVARNVYMHKIAIGAEYAPGRSTSIGRLPTTSRPWPRPRAYR